MHFEYPFKGNYLVCNKENTDWSVNSEGISPKMSRIHRDLKGALFEGQNEKGVSCVAVLSVKQTEGQHN